jgi:hypothetical protein
MGSSPFDPFDEPWPPRATAPAGARMQFCLCCARRLATVTSSTPYRFETRHRRSVRPRLGGRTSSTILAHGDRGRSGSIRPAGMCASGSIASTGPFLDLCYARCPLQMRTGLADAIVRRGLQRARARADAGDLQSMQVMAVRAQADATLSTGSRRRRIDSYSCMQLPVGNSFR